MTIWLTKVILLPGVIHPRKFVEINPRFLGIPLTVKNPTKIHGFPDQKFGM